ncbi:hypothetical protein EJ04DRAFT_22717 [Polyplosphaeria fusca]|uniref:Uncharacterized protein n=1 Tax=Polyplosphaeria fusca TaxID=682080 RepID=A0A9P4V5F1_9PLEO|nr:hypothetical protein EJ04DRAFT_22717 [Polyplosphaeria fusca]
MRATAYETKSSRHEYTLLQSSRTFCACDLPIFTTANIPQSRQRTWHTMDRQRIRGQLNTHVKKARSTGPWYCQSQVLRSTSQSLSWRLRPLRGTGSNQHRGRTVLMAGGVMTVKLQKLWVQQEERSAHIEVVQGRISPCISLRTRSPCH